MCDSQLSGDKRNIFIKLADVSSRFTVSRASSVGIHVIQVFTDIKAVVENITFSTVLNCSAHITVI